MKNILLIIFFSLLLCCATTVEAKRLFVLDDATGIITEYSIKDFKVMRAIQIPNDLYFIKRTPDIISKGLLISESGRILYYDDKIPFIVRRLWYWDGIKEHRAEISKQSYRDYIPHTFSEPILDAENKQFYWIVNRVVNVREEPEDAYYSKKLVITRKAELYRLNFDDDKLTEKVISITPFAKCSCETGACDETCPVGRIVAPKGGIKDFFEIEHFVEDQLESHVEGHTYLEKRNNEWIKSSIDKKLTKPFVEIIYDDGCCNWVNDSSDEMFLIEGKKKKKVYDEWERFGNKDYDISFYIRNAELSPNFKQLAYTIEADEWFMNHYKETNSIRLSADGKENLQELEKIKTVLTDLPMVEVKYIDKEFSEISSIKKAELAGWIDNDRILLLKDGRLGTGEISTGHFKESPIKARSINQVFLR